MSSKSARLFLIFFTLILSSSSFAGGNKKALIIAVGDYPREGMWPKISSDKDVPLILNALHFHGFTDDNILIIQDSQATKLGIKSAFEKITRDAEEGDIMLIHYSGHGQQMWDKNGDELDGKDETIVPYDAPLKFIKNQYEGERHLSDDELEIMVDDLRLKLGSNGSLTMIFDACHSGTVTRGLAKSRGTAEFMGPSDWKAKPEKDGETFEFKAKTRGAGEDNLAPLVLFSGASASQLNFETEDEQGNSVGSLSYVISKVLLNSNQNTTYQEVFDQVRIEMSVIAPRQTPQVEGDIKNKLFGGKASSQENYFLNTQIIDGKTTVINAGTLSGLFNKSKVGLYPLGTKSIANEKAIATGQIINANLVNADVIWDTEVDKEVLRKNVVFVQAQNVEDLHLKVKLNIFDHPDLLSALQENIKKYAQVIEITEHTPQVMIEYNKTKTRGIAQIELITNSEWVVARENMSSNVDSLATILTQDLLQYAQSQYLRELNTRNNDLKVSVSLIPIKEVEKITTGEGRYKRTQTIEKARSPIEEKMDNGMPALDSGDMFKLRIVNHGTSVAYFTILDITPGNEVAVVIPGKKETPDEYKIRPGDTLELDRIYTIAPPYGTECFKLIATKEAIDLRQVVSSRGADDAPVNPMEKLLQKSYVQTKRGVTDDDEDVMLPADIANVFTFLFQIK